MNARARAIIGAVAWFAFVAAKVPNLRHDVWAHALLLFAALVLVPLAVDLLGRKEETGRAAQLFAWAGRLQMLAGLALEGSCWLQPGVGAALAALPWMACTALLAAVGLVRLRREGWGREMENLSGDVALIFLAVGGAWTLADRAGYQPLGFAAVIVALTAVHFHYAGFLLPLFAGQIQRELPISRFVSRAAVGVILGVPAVAVGITTAQLGWGPNIEAAAGCALAVAGIAIATLHVRLATEPRTGTLLSRTSLGVCGVSLFFGMVLAVLYAVRPFAQPFPWLDLVQMRMLHGTINAFGFGLCGVLAWRQIAQRRNAQ